MIRKNFLAASVGFVLVLSGCGGGGSDDESQTQITTGTGFYVDSAVSGVKYACGASEGTTDDSGKFTFEVGKDCTFFLGDIKLRDVDKEILKNGVTVYETDAATAQILQSLDSDGNPTNGITISEEFVTALSSANITTLPTNEAETIALLEAIENAGGTIISLIDAQGHALSTFITGRDVYAVSEDGFNEGGIGPYRFNSDGSTTGFTDTDTWRVDGDKLYFGTGTNFSQYISTNEEYSIFYDDGDSNGITRVYTDKTKAEAYLATLGNTTLTELEQLIIGNTYYNTTCNSYTENGQTIENDHVETLVFGTDNKLNITWIQNGEQKKRIYSYSIANEQLTIIGTESGDVVLSKSDVQSFYQSESTAENNLSSDCS